MIRRATSHIGQRINPPRVPARGTPTMIRCATSRLMVGVPLAGTLGLGRQSLSTLRSSYSSLLYNTP